MRSKISVNQPQNTKCFHRLLSMFLCLIMVFSMCGTGITYLISATDYTDGDTQQEKTPEPSETHDEIKARLMRQIQYENWDPYSEDMSLDEFYALMELFDEGKLPLGQISAYASVNATAADKDSYIPRTKFLFAGLKNYVPRDGDNDRPEIYDNGTNYEQVGSEYNYPQGLDPYGFGYMRPPLNTWDGIKITDTKTNRVVLVSKDANAGNPAVAGDVIQSLFAKYTGYYVKQVTIDGANINVLGVIDLGDKYIYYYLSAEEQNTQVSTTTLSDEAKFVIEYVPVEHTVDYVVKMDGIDDPITDQTPPNVVFYGSNSPTTLSWVDSIFTTTRPNRTTDGAYSFDVFVPYGYELRILISIEMTVDIPYQSQTKNDSFHVEIDHTSKKEDIKAAWLKAYSDYLQEENLIAGDISDYITEKTDAEGKLTLTWKDTDDPNQPSHDSVLSRMAERINDFVLHNNGYPLGTYPQYTEKGDGGFKILPNSNGPTEHTMNDTFYNHLVKADRTITAILKRQEDPTFDVSRILQNSNGASNRGGSAIENVALQSVKPYDKDRDYYDADYAYHAGKLNGISDPLPHDDPYPNIKSVGRSYNWNSEGGESFKGKPQNMVYDAATGTYSYAWIFQTNTGDSFYLDAFEVNGIAITIPYFPKYNWQDSYKIDGKVEIADEKHPYYSETTLADGSILRLEFLLGWNAQRHYRVTVTGARSNVVVTGLNLMQYNGGAPEFSTYNLAGVYSDQGGYSQTAPAIEYYDKTNGWTRRAQGNVIVESIDYNGASDPDLHGANIRFKIADGYGYPYYMWANRWGEPINGQASIELDANGNITSYNPIISLKGAEGIAEGEAGALVPIIDGTGTEIGKGLNSQYIYDGGDGYYYIRVTNQKNYDTGKEHKFALLTVIARTVKFTVRYTPEYTDDTNVTWNGFVIDSGSGEAMKLTADLDPNNIFALNPGSMPSFDHDPEICALWEMAKDETGTVPDIYSSILHQYDDNDGPFYDLLYNTMATIANNSYGTIRPKDTNKNYTFVNWIVVGEDFMPVKDANGSYIQFLSGAIDFTQYAHYAVKHTAFGSANTDIHVLRLMPVWKPISDPFTYNVVLNWVDALGNIHAENFSGYWDEVVTEKPVGEQVYVYLNTHAGPLCDWIANHPTYTFWDGVNNATDDKEITAALADYLRSGATIRAYLDSRDGEIDIANLFNALTQKSFTDANGKEHEGNDTFSRLGSDTFVVSKDGGTISVWMYETKGGLVFHKDVQKESFIPDDEFYFTVTDAKEKAAPGLPFSGTCMAYPEFVYDEDGGLRERTNEDAMVVEFRDGKIVSIDGNTKVTYFTLKAGEGIAMYGPEGQYTVVELGSKSGGAYKVGIECKYSGDNTPDDANWEIPDEELWLKGSSTSLEGIESGTALVKAKVDFKIGENNVVQVLTFTNKTTSLSIEVDLDGVPNDKKKEYAALVFSFAVELTLPEGYNPLRDDEKGEFYFNLNTYHETVKGKQTVIVSDPGRIILTKKTSGTDGAENVWIGNVELKAGYWADIVMHVADDGEINYHVDELDELMYELDDNDEPKSMRTDYYLFPSWETKQEGTAVAGEISKVIVINRYRLHGYLAITEKNGNPNESFLYRIRNKSTGEEMIVSVKGGGETIVYAPAGEYTIEEITDWSWRYEEGVCDQSTDTPKGKTAAVTVAEINNKPGTAVHADYTNKRNDKVWLGGENSKNNHFTGPVIPDEEQAINSRKQQVALPFVNEDERKKQSDGTKEPKKV